MWLLQAYTGLSRKLRHNELTSEAGTRGQEQWDLGFIQRALVCRAAAAKQTPGFRSGELLTSLEQVGLSTERDDILRQQM